MKQRMFNTIISLFNFIGIICLVIITIMTNSEFGINMINTFEIRSGVIDTINKGYYFTLITIIIVNLIYCIINRKNKKLTLWYAINTIVCTLEIIAVDMDCYITGIFSDYIDISFELEEIYNKAIVIIYLLLIILPVVIDIVRIVKNKESKKKIILYLLLIPILIGICYFAELGLVNAVVVFLTIMQLIDNRNIFDEKEKNGKVILNIFVCAFMIISIIGITTNTIYTYQHAKKVDLQTTELSKQIKENFKKIKKDKQIIVVHDSEKGDGAVNLRGVEVIPCGKYDSIMSEENCDVLLAWKEPTNQYIYLNKDGSEITHCDNAPTPWMADNKFKENQGSTTEDLFALVKGDTTFSDIKVNENTIEQENDEYENDVDIQKYKLNDSYTIEIEQNDTEDVNIRVIDNNNNIISEENNAIVIETIDIDKSILKTFTDGSVPFYNIDNKRQGWFDAKTGKKYAINGNVEILDVIEDKVLIRKFDSEGNTIKEYILNKEGKTLFDAEEVHELKNGFIIKNSNDKYVYINSNLEIKSGEYDYINGDYAECGVLICKNDAETDSDNEQYSLIDTEGNDLLNRNYECIGSGIEEVKTDYLLDDEIDMLFS